MKFDTAAFQGRIIPTPSDFPVALSQATASSQTTIMSNRNFQLNQPSTDIAEKLNQNGA